ncbi:RHS repeat protein [bacterium]|nr:MAG: RHS repeat protein [bacterium]RIK61655.1 MAG: hypothetical protein DCC64_12610 [Planctomycetota bacterium]
MAAQDARPLQGSGLPRLPDRPAVLPAVPAISLFCTRSPGRGTMLPRFRVFLLLAVVVAAHSSALALARASQRQPQEPPGGLAMPAVQPWDLRPAAAFTSPAAGSDTAGAFEVALAFSAASGPEVDPAMTEILCSRDIDLGGQVLASGTNLAQVPGFLGSLGASGATFELGGSGRSIPGGDCVFSCRVANVAGRRSDWASRRVCVEGASGNVFTCPSPLWQGASGVTLTLTGGDYRLADQADFGPGIEVLGVWGFEGFATVAVHVSQTAPSGWRSATLSSSNPLAIDLPAAGAVEVGQPCRAPFVSMAQEAPRNGATAAEGVVLASGAFTHEAVDLELRGVGLSLVWQRSYRSDLQFNGPLGRCWTGEFFQRALLTGSVIQWQTGQGRSHTFTPAGDAWLAPPGVYVRAARDAASGHISLQDRNGVRRVFNPDGSLWMVQDPCGNRIECEYDGHGRLERILDDRGRWTRLHYGADGRVLEVCDHAWSLEAPRRITYAYGEGGHLESVALPQTAQYEGPRRLVTQYEYDADRLSGIRKPREVLEAGGLWLENQYHEDRVWAQRIAGGPWTQFRYLPSGLRRVVGPRGLRRDVELDAWGRAASSAEFTGFWTVGAGPSADPAWVDQIGAPLRATDPAAFIEHFEYNSHHELTLHRLPDGSRQAWIYPEPQELSSGLVASLGANLLRDDSQSWQANAFAGAWLRVQTSLGARSFEIVSNNENTLFVPHWEDLLADGVELGSSFSIHSANPDALAAGNCLFRRRYDGLGPQAACLESACEYEPRFQQLCRSVDARGQVTRCLYGYQGFAAEDPAGCHLTRVELPEIVSGQETPQLAVWTYGYDERGRRTFSTDPAGVRTEYAYSVGGAAEGFLQSVVVDPAQLALTHEFERNSVGLVVAYWPPRAQGAPDRDAFRTSMSVNELDQTWHWSGPILTENGAARRDVYCIFDPNGLPERTFEEYVTFDGLEPAVPANPHDPTSYSKSEFAMSPTWVECRRVYDGADQPVACVADAVAGATVTRESTVFEYDAAGNLTAVISPEGRRTTFAYDERNLLLCRTDGAQSAEAGEFLHDYDLAGRLTRVTDPRGFHWSREYDGFGRLTRVIDPLGHFRAWVYDPNGSVLEEEWRSSENQLLRRTCFDVDEAGRVWRQRTLALDRLGEPIGSGESVTLRVHDAASRLTLLSRGAGAWNYEYDSAGRLRLERDPAGNERLFGRDADGHLTQLTHRQINGLTGQFEETLEHLDYDCSGRWIRYRDQRYGPQRDTEVRVARDSRSRVVKLRDGGQQEVLASACGYDLRDRLVSLTVKAGADVTEERRHAWTWDADGLLTGLSVLENPGSGEPQWRDVLYERDARGRVTAMRRPDGRRWEYDYDGCSNVTARLDPADNQTLFTVDARGLTTSAAITRGPGVLGATLETREFDALGRMIAGATFEGEVLLSRQEFQYNSLDAVERVLTTLGAPGAAVTFEQHAGYDAQGHCAYRTYWDGRNVALLRDALSRVSMAHDQTAQLDLAALVYGGPQRVLQAAWGNGWTSTWSYESVNGAGGCSTLPARVEHSRQGHSLLMSEALYGPRGEMLAHRCGHEGAMGEVRRLDALPRPEILRGTLDGSFPAFFSEVHGPIQGHHLVDDFRVGPAEFRRKPPYPVVTDHPMDDFRVGPAEFKRKPPYPVVTDHPMDDFRVGPAEFRRKPPYPVVTDHPMDDFRESSQVHSHFSGVDLSDFDGPDDFNGLGDPALEPAAFGLACRVSFDSAGNRRGPEAMRLLALGGHDVRHDEYTVASDGSHAYISVSGRTLTYNASRQVTWDERRGLYFAYDWQGRVVLADDSPDLQSPLLKVVYDALGRRVLDVQMHPQGGVLTPHAVSATLYGPDGAIAGEAALDGQSQILGDVQLLEVAPNVVLERARWGGTTEHRYRHQDVLGRVIGVTNGAGRRIDEYGYSPAGLPLRRRVVTDVGGHEVAKVRANHPQAGQTRVDVAGLPAAAVVGRELCMARPGALADRYLLGRVLAADMEGLTVSDPDGKIAVALLEGWGFVIFDFADGIGCPGPSTGGSWSSGPVLGGGQTHYTFQGGGFAAFQRGWAVCPDASKGVVLPVEAVADSSTLSTRGNALPLTQQGRYFRLYAPVGTSAIHGASEVNYLASGSVHLLGLRRYLGPLAGHFDGVNIVGAQPGRERQGAWIEGCEFDIDLGRRRTPRGDESGDHHAFR